MLGVQRARGYRSRGQHGESFHRRAEEEEERYSTLGCDSPHVNGHAQMGIAPGQEQSEAASRVTSSVMVST